jgi:hypothetical protein
MSDPIKFIFIVTADGAEFDDLANERTIELCRKFYAKRLKPSAVLHAPATLRFVHFFCRKNAINVFDFPLSSTTKPRPPTSMKRKWKALSDFTPSGDPSFSPAMFVDSAASPFTILNIYHSIRGAPPHSVLELSIFCHAWAEGPLIRRSQGSDDDPPAPVNGLPMRRADDPNGRARTDFADNMGENPTEGKPKGKFPRTGGKDALEEFKAALDPKASFIIFGCNGQDAVRDPVTNERTALLKSSAGQVIHQAYLLPIAAYEAKKKNDLAKIGRDLAKGHVPDTPLSIDMGAEFDDERRDADAGGHYDIFVPGNDAASRAADKEARKNAHYGLDNNSTFFPAPSSTDFQFTREWTSVLGFVARRTQQTYAFTAASKLGIDVISGPVGTKSSIVENDQMKVCGPYKRSECTRIVHFHESFMRTSPSAKAERRYFVYDAATIANINTLAKNP